MFITKKHLPRRTFLQGLGVSLALPLLDSMIPAATAQVKTAALPKSRFCGIYIPHGATMDKWMPATEGGGFAFTETLKPLEKLRDRIVVVSNLAHPLAGGKGSDAGADHARSAAVFLSGAHPEKGTVHGGKTVDQLLADHIGQDTPLPSIEVCLEEVALNCGAGYGCAYYNTISWRNDTLPLPMENSPQVVFERLFGDGSNAAQRLSRKQQDKSILDAVTDKVARLQHGLDTGDRARLGEYLDNVREIERRIQKATAQAANNPDVPEAPVGVPEAFEDHIKLMYDLQVLAYQAEITRISTMMYARDTSGAVYPGSGVRDGFHTASHHSNQRTRMDSYAQINRYHVQMLGYFLEKLRSTPDGDGTLLDHSVVLYGSSMSNGNQHDHDPLPVLVAGGAAGQLKGDRHLVFPPHTPMSNLMLSLLDKLGVHQDRFGDSTGKLEILNQRTYRAGEEVEDVCRACKVDRTHTVIVVDGSGWPLRVQCDYCESQHNYRGGPRMATPGRPEADRPEGPQLRDSASPKLAAPPASAPPLALVSDRERTAPPMSLQNQSDDLELLLRRIIREEAGVTTVTPAAKWRGGTLVLRPGTPGLQEKTWPIETFFHKVVMLRNRLRTLEQQVNSSELPDDVKLKLQAYVSGCYGSLTSFNVLFADEGDQFKGSGGD